MSAIAFFESISCPARLERKCRFKRVRGYVLRTNKGETVMKKIVLQYITERFQKNKNAQGDKRHPKMRTLLPGLALLLSCHLVLPSAASAANYYVHASKGSNSSSGKAPDAAFRDLS